jgi:DNA-binding CsgD family transcriptional regulator
MKFTSLTPRERDVLRLVPTGMRNKQIAKKLGITERTVKHHRGQGMHKLGAVNVAELVGLVRDGLDVEDPIRSALVNARRLLLAISRAEIRGGHHVGAAIRQITKAIKANERCSRARGILRRHLAFRHGQNLSRPPEILHSARIARCEQVSS